MSLSLPFALSDRYELTEEIGRGGHAVVYRASDRVLDRDVAVKLLRDDALSADTLARFRQEVQVTAQLEHAHILHVYDTGVVDGRPFIVMELASGRTLAERLEREGQLPIADALQIARDVGLALAHAHTRRVVHRDVKPENVLLGPGGAILADFGIARVTQEVLTQKITSTGTTVGTVQYMSPEQLCAEPNIDAKSDQYSLACVLYEMLAGVRPHIAATFEGLRLLRMTGRHVPVNAHRPSVPVFVDAAISQALSPMPADRFRSMTEFLRAIGVDESGEFRVVTDDWGVVRASGERAAVSAQRGAFGSGGRAMFPGRPAAASPAAASGGAVSPSLSKLRTVAMVTAIVATAIALALPVAMRLWKGARGDVAGGVADDGRIGVLLRVPAAEGVDSLAVESRVARALRAELSAWPALREIASLSDGDTSAFVLDASVGAVSDSTRVRLDVRRAGGAMSRPVELLLPTSALQAPGPVMAKLVLQALVREADSVITVAEAPGVEQLPSRNLAALRAYVRGFSAMRGGMLDSASAHFRAAAEASKGFAIAEYWAAQSGAWVHATDVSTWQTSAENAVRSGALHGVDSLMARGLAAMSRADFPTACAAFRAATSLAPESFVPWYQLGECQRLDRVVVQRAGGLLFRSSHWSALQAYRKSTELAPTSSLLEALFDSVMRMTYAIGNTSRAGVSTDPDQRLWFALPSLAEDSLAFVPVSEADFTNAGARSVPLTWLPAMRLGREILLRITEEWVRRTPSSAGAWYHRAIALELAGEIQADSSRMTASGALALTERLDTTHKLRSRIAVARTRLALRRADLSTALTVARTAVGDTPNGDDSVLLPLAVLLGDVHSAIRLTKRSSVLNSSLPQSFIDSLTSFTARSAIGECDGMLESQRRLNTRFEAAVARAQLSAQRAEILLPIYRAAVPCIGPHALDGFDVSAPIDRAYRALANVNREEASRILNALPSRRAGATIGTITWDATFAESWAHLQTGDTTTAKQTLLGALENLSSMSFYTLDEAAQAAGLRGGILLLARLASPNASPNEQLRTQPWIERAGQLVTHPPSDRNK